MTAVEPSRGAITLDPRSRYLPPTEAHGVVLGADESLAAGLHRITTDQLTVAIDALSTPDADIAVATRAAMLGLVRVAAVLRLVETTIGAEAYDREMEVVAETRTLMAALQEGQAELRALDQLRSRYQSVLVPDAFADLRDQLLRRHRLLRLQAIADGEALVRSLQRLRRARARFGAWPVDGNDTIDPASATGEGETRAPVPDRFDSVADGLRESYRHCRRVWRRLDDGEPVAPEEWLDDVDVLAVQLGIVGSVWPDVLGATAVAVGSLRDCLAESRSIGALADVLAVADGLHLDPVERSMLLALVDRTGDELTDVARSLGRRLFAESSRMFTERVGIYWQVARG